MLKLVKNNLKYLQYLILCGVFFIKTAFADDINMPKPTYQLLYAYSGKIDTNNSKLDDNIDDGVKNDVKNKNDNNQMFSFVNNIDNVEAKKKDKQANVNKYNDTFIFAGIGFGTSGFGLNAGGNYKMFGIRMSVQTLQINSTIKVGSKKTAHYENVSLKLFNGCDYGVDFMIRPISYFHIDIGFHYFKNIVSVYYANKNLANKIGLNGWIIGGDVDVKVGGSVVPYVGVGFNIRLFAHLYLDIDVGVMLTGDYKIKSFQVYIEDDAKNRAVADVNPSYKDIEYITNYKAEQHNYKVWPIAKIGFSYRYNL